MKKILLSLVVPLVFITTLSAQISQEQADQIIVERLSNEAGDFTIYAKEDMQTEFEITTSNGEIIELDYPCWVYYVNYAGETNGKYLVVKESNGNLLEVNAKNDELDGWRVVPNINHSVWICKKFNAELSFYPSMNILKISADPPLSYAMHLLPNNITTDYYLMDGRLHMDFYGSYIDHYYWNINHISDNEMELFWCCIVVNQVGYYRFVRLTKFNGL